jgi:hypothetical protein
MPSYFSDDVVFWSDGRTYNSSLLLSTTEPWTFYSIGFLLGHSRNLVLVKGKLHVGLGSHPFLQV